MNRASTNKLLDFSAYRDPTKPLQIPANFDPEASVVEQVIFTLGYMMEGSVKEVAGKLHELNPSLTSAETVSYTDEVLNKLKQLAKVSAMDVNGRLNYYLHKEVVAHKGKIDPDN